MLTVPSTQPPPPPATLSDEDVVARVKQGELALFEVLMRRYNQRCFRVARSLLKNDAEAEEVVQQAWLAAWEHLDNFRGAARFSTWLVRIAVNESLMRARVAGRQLSMDDPGTMDFEMPTTLPTPLDSAEMKELARLLERAVDALPDPYRAVFVLREVEGLSTADTAAALDLTEDLVKVRLHRARTRLREDLVARVGTSATEVFTFGNARCDRTVERVMRAVLAAGPADT
jgi:RNA polymerase sigma-70 factor (ECF subfamily)